MLFRDGDVFEVRAPKCSERAGGTFTSTVSGYFTHATIDAATQAIAALDARDVAPGIYVTLNGVQPGLLARAANQIKSKAQSTTQDSDVVKRRWLLLDFDPCRPAGVSASNSELETARDAAAHVMATLAAEGWPEPVVGMSGNGVHALYAVDLPTGDDGLIQRVLAGLADRFDTEHVKIDRSVHNAARITKVLGTRARKGDNLVGVPGMEDRPHRRSALISAPAVLATVPRALLEQVALPKVAPPAGSGGMLMISMPTDRLGKFERFEHTVEGVGDYLERHGFQIRGQKSKDDCTWLHLDRCPVVPGCVSEGGSNISVGVARNGAIAYRNQHNRGQGLTWLDVREALEPGYRAWVDGRGWEKSGASGGSVSASGGGVPEHWPAPQPLPEALPPVIPFDPSLLPEALQGWIEDIADRVQCPIDFPAVAAMIALAAVVGRKVGIRPKRHDDWTVVPNLWGGVIGRPGVMKTPAILDPLKPLRRLEMAAKEAFDAAEKAHEADDLVSELERKETEKRIKAALKSDRDNARRMAMESIEGEAEAPIRARYIVNDSTVEKLGEILNQNPNGVLVYRDELIGLLKSLDKEGQEGARSFYLEAWNGTGRYTYDRIARGTIDIEAAIVSIIGGIQPGPISQYLRGAAKEGLTDDGLMQRFQLMVWPDISADWINVDRWPDSVARNRAFAVFEGLNGLEPILLGADTDPMEPEGIPFVRFEPEAQEAFDAWRGKLEALVRGGELHPALESHLSKFRSLIPSLALLIHLADGGTGRVGLSALNRAIAWGVYLRSHAERIYSQSIHPDIAAARSLGRKIIAGELNDGFSLRDLYRKGWVALGSPEEAEAATKMLVDLDWLVEVKVVTAGRPTTVFRINPRLHELKDQKNSDPRSEGTDRTDESPPPAPNSSPSGSSGSAGLEGSPKNEPDGGWGES